MWGKTVDSFIQALDHREDWQGSLAIGPTWSDNLNQSSESVVTYRYVTAEETIVVKRSLPKAVSAHGQNFEATLNRRMAISGHHGMFVRSLLYGQAYEKESMYNESTLISNAGYSYHDASNQYAIGPSYEFSTIGSDAMYSAWGLRGEWLHTPACSRSDRGCADDRSSLRRFGNGLSDDQIPQAIAHRDQRRFKSLDDPAEMLELKLQWIPTFNTGGRRLKRLEP